MANITGTERSDTITPQFVYADVIGGPPTGGADRISGLSGGDKIDGRAG